MIKTKIKVTGAKQVIAKLKKVERQQRGIVKRGLEAGGDSFITSLRPKIPIGPYEEAGYLRASLVMESKATVDRVIVRVGPNKRAFYGYFLELGTADRYHVQAKSKRSRGKLLGKYVGRIRASRHRFMRPVWLTRKVSIRRDVLKRILKRLIATGSTRRFGKT